MQTAISLKGITREKWLKGRKKYLGGSDIGAILGLNPYKSAVDVYMEKIGEQDQPEMNEAMEAGLRLENAIAEWYKDKTGNNIRKDNKIRLHPNFKHLGANIDRLIFSKDHPGEPGILECKTISSSALHAYTKNGWDYPPSYYAQIQHYFNITGYKWGALVFLKDGRYLIIFDIEADQDFIREMTGRLNTFWEAHVLLKNPPFPADAKDVLKLHPESNGKDVESNERVTEAYKAIKYLKARQNELQAEIDTEMDIIKKHMADNERLTFNEMVLATWKSNVQKRFDTTAFKKDHPDLAEKYYKENIVRKFLLK